MGKPSIGVLGCYIVGMTMRCERFPCIGETLKGWDFSICHGGKGSNQAVAARRLGAEVFFGACVGDDDFGKAAKELYQAEGIEAELFISPNGRLTGCGFIAVDNSGENEILIDPAANNDFSEREVDALLPRLRDCDLVLMQLEGKISVVEYAASKCRQFGIPFVLNPAPFQPVSQKLLENCTFIIPNEVESRQLIGLSADDDIEDEEVADRIRAQGAKNVIITLGKRGSLLLSAEGKRFVPGIDVETIDSTGAGDTFSAAFCVAYAEGKPVEEAVRFANAAAGLSVTKYGVIESLPFREQVEEQLSLTAV